MTHSLELPRLNTPDLAEISRANEAFENSPASRIIVWAAETFENRIVLASSFQDAVLVDIVARTVPGLPVVFLDTGYHFAETIGRTSWFQVGGAE